MKKILFISFMGTIFSSVIVFSQSAPDENLLIGMFDGRTPCRELAMQLHQPATPECIKIKWRLHLYRDAVSSGIGTFVLQGITFRDQDKLTGQWNLIRGSSADPDALVYELVIPGRGRLLLQKVDDNMLFFLDQQKNLMVGNRDFSYVLSRTEPKKLL